MFRNLLLVCLFVLPGSLFAQSASRAELLDKTWHFMAIKCSDKVASGPEDQFVHNYYSLKLTARNGNNINYGTYTKVHKDMRDNPVETGTYSLTTDEVGNLILTLRKSKSDVTAKYQVAEADENFLKLIRTDEGDKCNISYAVAP